MSSKIQLCQIGITSFIYLILHLLRSRPTAKLIMSISVPPIIFPFTDNNLLIRLRMHHQFKYMLSKKMFSIRDIGVVQHWTKTGPLSIWLSALSVLSPSCSGNSSSSMPWPNTEPCVWLDVRRDGKGRPRLLQCLDESHGGKVNTGAIFGDGVIKKIEGTPPPHPTLTSNQTHGKTVKPGYRICTTTIRSY